MTRSQNLAPSFCSSHRPRTSLPPSARTPKAIWIALLRTMPSSRVLDADRVEKDKRVNRIERPLLPGGDLVEHGIRDRADQIGRHLDPVKLLQVPRDLPGAHAARIHRHDLLVEPRKAALIFGDQLRIEARLAVTWHVELQLARVRHHRLAAITVAGVAGAVVAGEVIGIISAFSALSVKAFFSELSSPPWSNAALASPPASN